MGHTSFIYNIWKVTYLMFKRDILIQTFSNQSIGLSSKLLGVSEMLKLTTIHYRWHAPRPVYVFWFTYEVRIHVFLTSRKIGSYLISNLHMCNFLIK